MDAKTVEEMDRKVRTAKNYIEKIEQFDELINFLSKGVAQSAWISDKLIPLHQKDCLGNGYCSEAEAKELSSMITGYLKNVIRNSKKEIEEKLENLQ